MKGGGQISRKKCGRGQDSGMRHMVVMVRAPHTFR